MEDNHSLINAGIMITSCTSNLAEVGVKKHESFGNDDAPILRARKWGMVRTDVKQKILKGSPR